MSEKQTINKGEEKMKESITGNSITDEHVGRKVAINKEYLRPGESQRAEIEEVGSMSVIVKSKSGRRSYSKYDVKVV